MNDEKHIPDEEKKPSAKEHFLLMALLVLIGGGVAVYANFWKENRVVGEVVVEGHNIVAAREILALAQVPTGAPLFALDLFAIEQRVMKHHYVKSVAVHRDVPHRVRISIEERIPVAAMLTDKLYYLDAEGYVLPPPTLSGSRFIFDLPVLSGSLPPEEVVVGRQTKNKNILLALNILSVAKEVDEEMYQNISEIRVDTGRDFVFYTSEFGIPVIVGRENVGAKLVKFDAFWRDVVARNGAQELRYIDLRFDDQVVVRYASL